MVSAHTYTFRHVYYGLPTPLRIYTLVMILNLFYFHFIYSILYILHRLIFKNTSSHFATQYRIAQKYYLSLLELSPLRNKSYFALIRLARTRSRLHSLRVHSHLRSLNRIHLPTSNITFYT